MNALFNSALRQSNSIRKELSSLTDAPSSATPALQGQLNASLTSFSRTIEEYNALAKQEIVASKQEKAYERVTNFRSELTDYREQFDRLKKEKEETQTSQNRAELLGRRPHHAATPENPYSNANMAQNSVFKPSALGTGSMDFTREQHAFREQSFAQQTNAQLDEFLERGRAMLGDLGQQRDMLKNTQKKLYSVATTLGISGDTIRMIERRAKQDKWIFWAGVITFFLFCWLVLHYLT